VVFIPEDSELRRIGGKVFNDTLVKTIRIPRKVEFLNGLSLMDLSSVSLSRDNPYFCEENDLIFDGHRQVLVWNGNVAESVEIPDEVEVLGEFCFFENRNVREIRFGPNSRLMRIEQGAFEGSTLESIYIPSGVTFLGDRLFYNCQFLHEVAIGDIGAGEKMRCLIVNIFCSSSLRYVGKQVFTKTPLIGMWAASNVQSQWNLKY
jgi:hypothetical protein